jgi:lipopolysaccharide/colanic/teichoic acid biosynthesis glycosyltransferase
VWKKRVFDVLVSSFLLIVLSPLLIIIAIAVRLDSPGPAIFRQSRTGYHGKPFTIFKFRTMRDGEVTRMGKLLRPRYLDELPQLWNIIRGDMSLVGPRPHMVAAVQALEQAVPNYRLRTNVLPGMTGPFQVWYGREQHLAAQDNARALSWDLFYVRRSSLALDFLLLICTIKPIWKGQGI